MNRSSPVAGILALFLSYSLILSNSALALRPNEAAQSGVEDELSERLGRSQPSTAAGVEAKSLGREDAFEGLERRMLPGLDRYRTLNPRESALVRLQEERELVSIPPEGWLIPDRMLETPGAISIYTGEERFLLEWDGEGGFSIPTDLLRVSRSMDQDGKLSAEGMFFRYRPGVGLEIREESSRRGTAYLPLDELERLRSGPEWVARDALELLNRWKEAIHRVQKRLEGLPKAEEMREEVARLDSALDRMRTAAEAKEWRRRANAIWQTLSELQNQFLIARARIDEDREDQRAEEEGERIRALEARPLTLEEERVVRHNQGVMGRLVEQLHWSQPALTEEQVRRRWVPKPFTLYGELDEAGRLAKFQKAPLSGPQAVSVTLDDKLFMPFSGDLARKAPGGGYAIPDLLAIAVIRLRQQPFLPTLSAGERKFAAIQQEVADQATYDGKGKIRVKTDLNGSVLGISGGSVREHFSNWRMVRLLDYKPDRGLAVLDLAGGRVLRFSPEGQLKEIVDPDIRLTERREMVEEKLRGEVLGPIASAGGVSSVEFKETRPASEDSEARPGVVEITLTNAEKVSIRVTPGGVQVSLAAGTEQDLSHFMERELYAVHATNYAPEGNVIRTRLHADRGRYPRDTLHWSLNHVVEDHMYGSWLGRGYFIIVPLQDLADANPGRAMGGTTVDFFFRGNVTLPGSAQVFRSKEEANLFLERKGEKMPGGNWAWGGSWEVTEQWNAWMAERGLFPAAHTHHWTTEWEESSESVPEQFWAFADMAERSMGGGIGEAVENRVGSRQSRLDSFLSLGAQADFRKMVRAVAARFFERATDPDRRSIPEQEESVFRQLVEDQLSYADERIAEAVLQGLPRSVGKAEIAGFSGNKIIQQALRRRGVYAEEGVELSRIVDSMLDQFDAVQRQISEQAAGLLPDLPPDVSLETLRGIRERWVDGDPPGERDPAEDHVLRMIEHRFQDGFIRANRSRLSRVLEELEEQFPAVRGEMERRARVIWEGMRANSVSLDHLRSFQEWALALAGQDPKFSKPVEAALRGLPRWIEKKDMTLFRAALMSGQFDPSSPGSSGKWHQAIYASVAEQLYGAEKQNRDRILQFATEMSQQWDDVAARVAAEDWLRGEFEKEGVDLADKFPARNHVALIEQLAGEEKTTTAGTEQAVKAWLEAPRAFLPEPLNGFQIRELLNPTETAGTPWTEAEVDGVPAMIGLQRVARPKVLQASPVPRTFRLYVQLGALSKEQIVALKEWMGDVGLNVLPDQLDEKRRQEIFREIQRPKTGQPQPPESLLVLNRPTFDQFNSDLADVDLNRFVVPAAMVGVREGALARAEFTALFSYLLDLLNQVERRGLVTDRVEDSFSIEEQGGVLYLLRSM